MTATVAEKTGLRVIPLTAITPNRDNPRKHFPQETLQELAESIKLHGVLEPVIVRQDPIKKDFFELVIGERRWRASKLAAKADIPAIVLELTDRAALEMMVIENLQREDVHPLDEAAGYHALLDAGFEEDKAVTVDEIAKKVGKSPSYVYARLKLASLCNAAREAFEEKLISPGHAVLIARLQVPEQISALAACFKNYVTADEQKRVSKLDLATATLRDLDEIINIGLATTIVAGVEEPGDIRVISEKSLREWIRENVNLKLKGVPWDLADANLVPEAGACANCVKRSLSNQVLFAELSDKTEDVCFDPACYQAKRKATVKNQIGTEKIMQRMAEAGTIDEAPAPLRQLSDVHSYTAPLPDQKVLRAGQWLEAKKGSCPDVEEGFFVRGERMGERLRVCCNGACKTHRHSLGSPVPPRSADDRRSEDQRREAEAKVTEAWHKHLEELLLSKVDGADRAGQLTIEAVVNELSWRQGQKKGQKKAGREPLHKAWTLVIRRALSWAMEEDPAGEIVLAFAEANKLDLQKLEKEFRAKQTSTSAAKAQAPTTKVKAKGKKAKK